MQDIKIKQCKAGFIFNQTDYIQHIHIYKVPSSRFKKETDKENTFLRSMVGSLNWAVHGLRLYAVFEMINVSAKGHKRRYGKSFQNSKKNQE